MRCIGDRSRVSSTGRTSRQRRRYGPVSLRTRRCSIWTESSGGDSARRCPAYFAATGWAITRWCLAYRPRGDFHIRATTRWTRRNSSRPDTRSCRSRTMRARTRSFSSGAPCSCSIKVTRSTTLVLCSASTVAMSGDFSLARWRAIPKYRAGTSTTRPRGRSSRFARALIRSGHVSYSTNFPAAIRGRNQRTRGVTSPFVSTPIGCLL